MLSLLSSSSSSSSLTRYLLSIRMPFYSCVILALLLLLLQSNVFHIEGWAPTVHRSHTIVTSLTKSNVILFFQQGRYDCNNNNNNNNNNKIKTTTIISNSNSFLSKSFQQLFGIDLKQQSVSVTAEESSVSSSSSPSPTTEINQSTDSSTNNNSIESNYDYKVPDDAVIHIKPLAMQRLRELRLQQQQQSASSTDNDNEYLLLRMGVRSGGCSGMSYVMDFIESSIMINDDDDVVDTYEDDKIKCVVDSKSMLYLYGLQLDYSPALIGGGFKFNNPNAEQSCGCGSSFGI